jgi:Ca2+-binding EF-hand superfamily protein
MAYHMQCVCMQALAKFGITDDVSDLLQAADTNGDGQIDYQEFVCLMRETNKELKNSGEASGLLRGAMRI